MSRNFRATLDGWIAEQGGDPIGNAWCAVVEQHRRGWPHCNFLLCSNFLREVLCDVKQMSHLPEGESLSLGHVPELRALALRAGWGPRSTIEGAQDDQAVAAYLTKVAGEEAEHSECADTESERASGASVGELAKVSQAPVRAPRGFRRLRSGVGWLPPKKKSEWHGALVDVQSGRVCSKGRWDRKAAEFALAAGLAPPPFPERKHPDEPVYVFDIELGEVSRMRAGEIHRAAMERCPINAPTVRRYVVESSRPVGELDRSALAR
jgi:hypothetical protein